MGKLETMPPSEQQYWSEPSRPKHKLTAEDRKFARVVYEVMRGDLDQEEAASKGITPDVFSNLGKVGDTVNTQYQAFVRNISANGAVPNSVKKMLESDEEMHGLPPFRDVVKFHFARYLVQNDVVANAPKSFLNNALLLGLTQYDHAYKYHIPAYEKTFNTFDSYRKDGRKPKEVYLGRDGVYAYLGRKAQDLARQRTASADYDAIKPKYLVYSTGIVDSADLQMKENYLRQEEITEDKDPLFFDTGFNGTIPDDIMSIMQFGLEGREDRIKLLDASKKGRQLPVKHAVDVNIYAIEDSAKPEGMVSDLEVNERGKIVHVAKAASPLDQFRFMMLRQAIARHFWMREYRQKDQLDSSVENREGIGREIESEVETVMPMDYPLEKNELIDTTTELYEKSKEFVAPVIVGFADHLLRSISGRDNAKLLFAGRDGLGSYEAAKALLDKFPEKYPDITHEQLTYAYLTRSLVNYTVDSQLRKYIRQIGVKPYDEVTLVDIGMYGTMINSLRPSLKPAHVEFLISKSHFAKGFIDNGRDKKMSAFKDIPGNPAVHFIEDTFSGPIRSPKFLYQAADGRLEPDTKDSEYAPDVTLKRKYALRAITDYVDEMQEPQIDAKTARQNLDQFLSNKKNFANIMVPHER